MNRDYIVGRDRYGKLSALAILPIGPARRMLRVECSKNGRGGISCDASAVLEGEDGRSFQHIFAFGGEGDDYRKVLAVDKKARASEKAIRVMMESVMGNIDPIMAEVKAYYAKEAS